MTELHKELGQCLMRAWLQSVMETAQSLSRDKRCLQACSSSYGRSPSADGRRKEIATWPRGDFLLRSSQTYSRPHSSRDHCQSANKPVRYLPGLLQDPTGIPCHLQVCHAHFAGMSDCTALWANFICSPSSGNPGRGRLAGHSLTVLWCTLWDTPITYQDQSQSVCPRGPQRNGSILTWLKTWVTQCH